MKFKQINMASATAELISEGLHAEDVQAMLSLVAATERLASLGYCLTLAPGKDIKESADIDKDIDESKVYLKKIDTGACFDLKKVLYVLHELIFKNPDCYDDADV